MVGNFTRIVAKALSFVTAALTRMYKWCLAGSLVHPLMQMVVIGGW
jgi:hypothetical protein